MFGMYRSFRKKVKYQELILQDNPVVYWRLKDINNNVKDEKNFSFGTYINNPLQNQPSLIKNNTTVNDSRSIRFTDNSQILALDNAINYYSTQRSFEFWFLANTSTEELKCIFEEGGNSRGFAFFLKSSAIYFSIWADIKVFAPVNITLGTVYHVVMTWNTGQLKGYLNSVEVLNNNETSETMPSHSNDNGIGNVNKISFFENSSLGPLSDFPDIFISEFAIYDNVLSDMQILRHYKNGID
jgi:hypothetical protein